MKVIFTGGGTAGHAMVNTVLIPYLQKKDCNVSYIGSVSGMEKEMVNDLKDVTYYGISTGKLRRYLSSKNITDIFRIIKGFFQSYKILKMEKPQLIYSSGGYVSVPVVWAAYLQKIPVLIRETDYSMGLANKLCIPFSKAVYVTFPDTKEEIKNCPCIDEGMIIRPQLYNIPSISVLFHDSKNPVCLIIGGSSGAMSINEIIWKNIDQLSSQYSIIHLCGKGNYNANIPDTNSYHQMEFVRDISGLYQLADVIITRSGSNAIIEGLLLGKRLVCIPLSSNSSRGEQMLNAKFAEANGTAVIVPNNDLTINTLLKAIDKVFLKESNYSYKTTKSALIKRIEHHTQSIYDIAFKQLQSDFLQYLKDGRKVNLNDLSPIELSILDELAEAFEY